MVSGSMSFLSLWSHGLSWGYPSIWYQVPSQPLVPCPFWGGGPCSSWGSTPVLVGGGRGAVPGRRGLLQSLIPSQPVVSCPFRGVLQYLLLGPFPASCPISFQLELSKVCRGGTPVVAGGPVAAGENPSPGQKGPCARQREGVLPPVLTRVPPGLGCPRPPPPSEELSDIALRAVCLLRSRRKTFLFDEPF